MVVAVESPMVARWGYKFSFFPPISVPPKEKKHKVKLSLPVVISESQSAFIPSRLITDNAMTTSEVFHSMKNKKRGKVGHIVMKLDMSKVYDTVE